MTLREARQTLRHGGEWVQLAEAIGVIISSSKSSLSDFLSRLNHPGFVAEQAAIALYVRTGRERPPTGKRLETNGSNWRDWLAKRRLETVASSLRRQNEKKAPQQRRRRQQSF